MIYQFLQKNKNTMDRKYFYPKNPINLLCEGETESRRLVNDIDLIILTVRSIK